MLFLKPGPPFSLHGRCRCLTDASIPHVLLLAEAQFGSLSALQGSSRDLQEGWARQAPGA